MTGRVLHWRIGGEDIAVRIEESAGHGAFQAGEQSFPFRVVDRNSHGGTIEIKGRRHRFYVLRDRHACTVWLDGRTYRLERIDKTRLAGQALPASSGNITALMPGKILRIEVAAGDSVKEKQSVLIMESMKMETTFYAPKSGRVAAIQCKPGDVVEMGELLMVIE